jgi:hypothetical protein
VELALLLEARAGIALAQGLELGPVLDELLGETPLCGKGVGPIGLLVLTAKRRRGGKPDSSCMRVCLVEAVELRKNHFAGAVVLGDCARGSSEHRRRCWTAVRAVSPLTIVNVIEKQNGGHLIGGKDPRLYEILKTVSVDRNHLARQYILQLYTKKLRWSRIQATISFCVEDRLNKFVR